jgi:hypothetical protein
MTHRAAGGELGRGVPSSPPMGRRSSVAAATAPVSALTSTETSGTLPDAQSAGGEHLYN